VDERPIQEVEPRDVQEFTQCHFFAGIGVWSYALKCAGWSDERPVWTGSCPCQPFSSASRGRGLGISDPRHLWPVWHSLITSIRPPVIFGEQVASSVDWFDGVCDDMETLDYEVGAAILPAVAVGQDHARHRLYFVGYTNSNREPSVPVYAEAPRMSWRSGEPRGVVPKNGTSSRMAQLRALGNSLVAPLAAEFIRAYLDATNHPPPP
jgi:DNA (cytosine-5)-methyltransferase 1